jgi:hypothetical protein
LSNVPSGGELRRQRDLGQNIDAALKVYRQNFGEFLGIAAVTMPISAIAAIAGSLIQDRVTATIVGVCLVIPNILVALVAQAAMVRAIADVADGVPPDFNFVYARVLERLGKLFSTFLRVLVIVLALCITIVGIPFGIYLVVRWAFFTQVVIIEGQSGREATDLSARLVLGHWWRTLGILVMIGLLASLPTAIVTLAFSAAAPVAGSLASAVVAAVALPFSVGAATLLFFDLSSRKAALAGVGDSGVSGD